MSKEWDRARGINQNNQPQQGGAIEAPNGNHNRESVARFMREHSEGIFGVVVGSLVRFSHELCNDSRFRFFTERDMKRKPAGVDSLQALIVITGFTRHDVVLPITQRAKRRGIPIFSVETTQKFARLVEEVFPATPAAAPAELPSQPSESPAPLPTPPPTPEPEAQPRTMSQLTGEEHGKFLTSLAKEFRDHGGTLTKMEFGAFLHTHPLNLNASTVSLWCRTNDYVESARKGHGGVTGLWKLGPALMEFIKGLEPKEQPAPAAEPPVPTGLTLAERIAALERERAALQRELEDSIAAKKRELAELEAEKAKLS